MNTIHLNQIGDKVIVKKGEGGGSASAVEYWDVSALDALYKNVVLVCSIAVKGIIEGMKGIYITSLYQQVQASASDVTAIAIDLSFELVREVNGVAQMMTVKQQLEEYNVDISAIPRITKEEFYTL